MGEPNEEKQVEEIKEEQVKDNDPVPYFKIGPQTFHSGMGSYPPDTIIPWETPEGWKADKWGAHYTTRPPSITWTPLNKAAKKLYDAQVEAVKKLTAPPPPPRDEKFERLMEAHQKQADQNAKLIELLAKLVPAPEGDDKGKKK